MRQGYRPNGAQVSVRLHVALYGYPGFAQTYGFHFQELGDGSVLTIRALG